MKEDILSVLIYLFEDSRERDNLSPYDQTLLKNELMKAGFSSPQISKAFAWLEGLVNQQQLKLIRHPRTTSLRVYSPKECEKLGAQGQGFLIFLEQFGVLDTISREVIINCAMTLETETLSLEHLKWIVLMVLFNQPGHEEALAWIEDLVYEEVIDYLH